MTPHWWKRIGPGIITGAADDDPSGISTYSVVGAQFGFVHLWTVFLTFPLMCGVQMLCARLGLVTGEGLAGALRRHSSRRLMWTACLMLAVANVVNIGADFVGMGDALRMVTGIPSWMSIPLMGGFTIWAVIFWRYKRLAGVLKWLSLVLIAYVGAAFLSRPNWTEVFQGALMPQFEFKRDYFLVLTAILGTTITPYMFFWQASQEVEEEREHGHRSRRSRLGATKEELTLANLDVFAGMAWAGITMFFIIVTTGNTLHRSGHTHIETAQQAAEALRPIAGDAAYLLFAIGLVGTGLLAIPVLAGSTAYAFTEAIGRPESIDASPHRGRHFYAFMAISVVLGLSLDFIGIPSIQALFLSAVLNGILSPLLVFVVTHLTSRPDVMGEHVSGRGLKTIGYLTSAIMALSAVSLLFSS